MVNFLTYPVPASERRVFMHVIEEISVAQGEGHIVELIFNDIVTFGPMHFICTLKMSQDPLEHFLVV